MRLKLDVYYRYSGPVSEAIRRLKRLYADGRVYRVLGEKNTLKVVAGAEARRGGAAGAKTVRRSVRSSYRIAGASEYRGRKGAGRRAESRIIDLFCDVDSTLTQDGIHELDRNVRAILERFEERNASVYFCSGRSRSEVDGLRRMYGTGEYAIAENGGIVIGARAEGEKRGDRREADKLLVHMNARGIGYRIDPKQKGRKTEVVLLSASIGRDDLERAISESGARVEFHSGRHTYHVSRRGVNKGAAIRFVAGPEELGLDADTHKLVALGDSGLDIPMFEACELGLLAGAPDRETHAKTRRIRGKIRVLSPAPDALGEAYALLFPD